MKNDNGSIQSKIAECRGLVHAKSVLSALDHELRSLGFAGSTNLPKLIFLCLYTRYLERPVSLVIKGDSSGGKSYALHAALRFIPDDAYEEFSGMSEKALLYMPDLDLKHRHLIIGEAAGLAEGTGRAFLRQLLSEGKIRYATVQSTADGLAGQELDQIEGPTGLILTTTANSLHKEDESRMLICHLDESPERIRDALVNQAKGLQVGDGQLDMQPWFALHELVGMQPTMVDIPYAETLAKKLPTSHFRVMRDFPHVLSLIRAHALMHQCTRDRRDDGCVIATLDDYAAVFDLVSKSLSEGLDNAVPETIRTLVDTVRKLMETDDKSQHLEWNRSGISQVKIAEALGRDQSSVSRNVAKAVALGFLRNLNPGQGREASLVLGERELPAGCVLPTPDELSDSIVVSKSPIAFQF